MLGLRRILIQNYWAHMYESVVFGVDGSIEESTSIDRNGNVSGSTLTTKSIEYHVDRIFSGVDFTEGNYPLLEVKYRAPRYKNRKDAQSGHYSGMHHLSFYGKDDKIVGLVLDYKPDMDFVSTITFYLSSGSYRFDLREYTSDLHKHMLSMLLSELAD